MSNADIFEYDNSDSPNVFSPDLLSSLSSGKSYGGYNFCNPEDACRKILKWFEKHPALSDEQAVYDLKIPNLRERISDLRKRGYKIIGTRVLIDVTRFRLFHSMVYLLHRDIPKDEEMPGYFQMDETMREEKTKEILAQYFGIHGYDTKSMRDVDRWTLYTLLQKSQQA